MKFTIVICTYNRSNLLVKTLESINKTLIPNDLIVTILVIANACSDTTLLELTKYQALQKSKNWLPLEFAEEPNPGKSNALNKALTLIPDGWICFVDDDHRLDNFYFKAIVCAIREHPETQLFCGKIIPDWNGKEPIWAHDTDEFKITPYPVPYFDIGEEKLVLNEQNAIPGGGNLIVTRHLFDSMGNFSTALGPKGHNLMGSEDSDFVLRTLKANKILRYIPSIIQYHYVNIENFALSYMVKKSFQRNRSITLTQHHSGRPKVPNYLLIKLINYLAGILLSFDLRKSRFYIVRFAGILGQIAGHIHSKSS